MVTEDTPGSVPTVSFSKMNVIDAAFLVRDVVNVLDAAGVFIVGEDGHGYIPTLTETQIEQLAPKVEDLLQKHGVTIPAHLDQLIKTIPLWLPAILGVQ